MLLPINLQLTFLLITFLKVFSKVAHVELLPPQTPHLSYLVCELEIPSHPT